MAELVAFRSRVASYGADRYGNRRYGITIPAALREKAERLYGREVVVIVVVPDGD